jgi:hypothetical protein
VSRAPSTDPRLASVLPLAQSDVLGRYEAPPRSPTPAAYSTWPSDDSSAIPPIAGDRSHGCPRCSGSETSQRRSVRGRRVTWPSGAAGSGRVSTGRVAAPPWRRARRVAVVAWSDVLAPTATCAADHGGRHPRWFPAPLECIKPWGDLTSSDHASVKAPRPSSRSPLDLGGRLVS